MKYQSGYSNLDVKKNLSNQSAGKSFPIGWSGASPLGGLIGVTNAAERLDGYNRQFSDKFAKYGVNGKLSKSRKMTVIVVHKQTKTITVVSKGK
jgi:hypothetical protein